MKLRQLHINNFGHFSEHDIPLSDDAKRRSNSRTAPTQGKQEQSRGEDQRAGH